jgi:hypothetical protein
MHIKEIAMSAMQAMVNIHSLSQLSMETGMKHFSLNIMLILTHGLKML